MDKIQAYLILGEDLKTSRNEDLLTERVEEAIFIEATFFMTRPFLPVLATGRIKKLYDIQEAAEALGHNPDAFENDIIIKVTFREETDLLSLLSVYHAREGMIKSDLLQSATPYEAISLYNEWIKLFEAFSTKYIALFEVLNVDDSNNKDNIRMSENPDSMILIEELQNSDFTHLALRQYQRLKKIMKHFPK